MNSNKDLALISALDLTSIKAKLMHEASGEGWSLERANAAEIEYRRFLYLLKAFPTEQVAPLEDVDTFWHYHILDTMKYSRDCEQAFGYFVHHCPDSGLDEANGIAARRETANRTRELYESSFGESYGRAPSAATQTAWCIGSGPCTGRAADAETAWCIGTAPCTGIAAEARTAYCIGTGSCTPMVKAADVQIERRPAVEAA